MNTNAEHKKRTMFFLSLREFYHYPSYIMISGCYLTVMWKHPCFTSYFT